MKLNSHGLYFKSVQVSGNNIVCFDLDNFKLIEYSERLYKAKEIKYEYDVAEDTIRKFAERNDEYLINSYNSDIDKENEEQVEYLLKWIKKERERNLF